MPSQPQTVTIAQALASTSSGLLVADTAAHIVAALPNTALSARIASVTIAAPAVLTAAQMSLLFPLAAKLHAPLGFLALSGANVCSVAQLGAYEGLPGFGVASGGSITLSDSTAQVVGMLATHPAWFAQVAAVTIHLDGTTIGAYPASQFNGLMTHGKTVVFVPSGSYTTLNVGAAAHDLASNAPSLNALASHVGLTISVTNDGTGISAADATNLLGLQGFHPSAHSLFVSDTGANIATHLAALLGQGYAQIQVVSGILAGTAAQLLDPSIHFTTGAHAQLSATATVGASTAAALAGLPGYTAASGAVLSVSDTAVNLLSNSSSWLSAAGAVSLSADAIVSAAAAQALGQIAGSFGARFSLAGHSLTVADTVAALQALPSAVASLATGFALTADATVSAAQFSALQAVTHLSLAGHTIAIADTAPALLALSGSDLGRAAAVSLSADATVTVAQMHLLVAEPGFNTAGHRLIVADQAATLSGLSHAETTLATTILVSGDATVNASQFSVLNALPNLSLNGHLLSVIDTATSLAGMTGNLTLVGATGLSADATVSAATFHALSALPNFTSDGHALTLTDTASNLLLLAGGNLSQVTSATLSTDAVVSAQQAQTLSAEPAFTRGGHQFTVSDTAANILALPNALLVASTELALSSDQTVSAAALTQLAALGSKFYEAGHALAVTDTAPALLALSGSALARATSVGLSADATVSAAQIQALSAMPAFAVAGHALIVADTGANLLAMPQGSLLLASAIELSADATLSAAAAQILTAKAGYTADTHTLTIADTAGTLAGLTTPVLAFASAEQVTVSATISAATATALASLPNLVEAVGVGLTIQDTMTSLLALSGPARSIATALRLVAGSVTSTDAAHAAALAAISGFSAGGATINVTDTLADLNASSTSAWSSVATTHAVVDAAAAIVAAAGSPVLTSASSVSLSAPATILAANATALAGMINFTGASLLTVTDSTAALIANAPALVSLGCAVNVTDSATVTVAGAASLALIQAASSHLSFGTQNLTISDSATNLALLSHTETALASTVTLSGDATVDSSHFATLAGITNLSLNGHLLTVSDTAANLTGITSHFALISATSLSADASVSAATFNTLSALPAFNNGGHSLTVADNATGLLGVTSSSLSQITSTILTADALVSAQQAQALAGEPGFTTGGHQLIISDSAANILALPHTLLLSSTELALSNDQTVSASVLTQLASLGLKFSAAGHIITCVDTAANLATLASSATVLANSEILAGSAIVSAATAAALAALPNLAAQNGAVLTVQDSVANILALGQGAPSLVSSEKLAPGSSVTISAAQAVALTSLPLFSATGATITVADTVAALNAAGTSVLQSIASSTNVVDSATNLASSSSSALLQHADAVTLAGNAQVSADVGAELATIPHFSPGPYLLTVADTAANTAQRFGAILTLGAHALVTDSGPVTATVADHLAIISIAGVLSFQGGNQLLVQDSFANLTSPANAAGLALAARLGILDTATNLLSASGHNWGALNPSYTLSQGGVISAATASGLTSLGSHFSSAGLSFYVSDTAANVVGAANALTALHIIANVSDTASNVDAEAANLATMGSAIGTIFFTDSTSVNAGTAGGLAALHSLIGGTPLLVVDNAANVDAQLSQLQALAGHVAITIHDTASNVGTYAADLSALAPNLTVTLSDTMPVAASTAVALAQVSAQLATGTQLAVSDTAAAISANASALATLTAHIGAITVSDGNTLSATNAAMLSLIDSHIAAGLQFTVVGTSAAVAAVQSGLTTLQNDGRIAAIDIFNTSVADVSAHVSAVNALSAVVTITDIASNVDASLTTLSQLNHLQSISLTDSGTPALSMNIATLHSDASTIAKINTSYTLTISDTAANISTDLSLGSSSVVLAHLTRVGFITATDAGTVTLTQSQLLTANVNDGPNSALAHFSGNVEVTGVDLAHITQIATGAHPSLTMNVADTAAHISADLAQGNSSLLLSNLSLIDHIDALAGGPISLTQQQALQTGIADSSQSALSKMSYTNFTVSGATVAGVAQLTSLAQQPTSILVTDTAADLSADLASSSSALLLSLPLITTVSVSDGQPITLTESQVMTAHLDDGPGSIMSKVVFGQLTVTNALASDLTPILDLSFAPQQVSLNDSAGHVLSNLSVIKADIGSISAITITGSTPLLLTASEALSLHTDDGMGSVIDRVVGHAFEVSGATVAQIAALTALSDAPSLIYVTDTSADIVADLTSGNSMLAINFSSIGLISVVGGHITLSDAQAENILTSTPLNRVFTMFDPATQVLVNAAPISDISALVGSGWPNISVGVADTASNIATDLASSSSVLGAYSASCSSVTLTAGGTVSASILGDMSGLHGFSADGYTLTLQDNATNVLSLDAASRDLAQSIHILDVSASIASVLDSLQAALGGHVSISLTDTSPSIVITAAQYTADQATIDAVTNTAVFNVTGQATSISAIVNTVSADAAVAEIDVNDSASNVVAALSTLQQAGPKLHVTLSDTSITANLISPLLGIGNLSPAGVTVIDAGDQIAAAVQNGGASVASYIQTYGATLAGDDAVTAADAATLETLTNFHKGANTLVVWDTAQHLASTGYGAALASPLIDGVHLKAPGGAVTVTANQAASLFSIPQFLATNPDGSSNTFTVSDTAQHIEQNIATLSTHRSQITAITVTGTTTVSDHVLSDLQSVDAVATAGTYLTVQDTAATIASNISSQTGSSVTISPVAWTLSANGTVTESSAASLGALPNFSAGSYTISLGLTTDTSISVSDANKLGNIRSALDLGGHHLIVTGSVAQLSALSNDALLITTPALIDTIGNVSPLLQTSPLLNGSIEITGSDSLTTTAAAALFALIRSGSGGPGISPTSLLFDSTHTVTDTIARLEQFTFSPGWANNVALHGSLHLVAADTITNLADPANTSYLSGIYGSTLLADSTIGVASATSLATIASTIHFNRGTFHVTVQDNANALISPANTGGLALADTVQLAGPDHVDATDAETLLNISNFHLTTDLTIVDTSTALLDSGALQQAIAGVGPTAHILVQLAGPETLDAETAQGLVSISGFSDSHNVIIADDPSYLLNGANLTAEHVAIEVTLPSDETVSANTILRLSTIPHFTAGAFHLALASNDFADRNTLEAVADLGGAYQSNTHSLTMTSDAINLTSGEYNSLQADNINKNGHFLGLIPDAVVATDVSSVLNISGHGVSGEIIKIYGADGSLISSASTAAANFMVTTSDATPGHNFTMTSTAPNGGSEGAPVVILDIATLESLVSGAGLSFATSGSVQVDSGKFLDIYSTGSTPGLTHPALVYDQSAHTVSLDLPGHSSSMLITLGGTTHPSALIASEFIFKSHG